MNVRNDLRQVGRDVSLVRRLAGLSLHVMAARIGCSALHLELVEDGYKAPNEWFIRAAEREITALAVIQEKRAQRP